MAIEIVSFPIKSCDFPYSYVTNYQRVTEGTTPRLKSPVSHPNFKGEDVRVILSIGQRDEAREVLGRLVAAFPVRPSENQETW